jgi:hypothetical protein
MKISERSISALAKIVTGDESKSPYKSGQMLVRFFNDLGFEDSYGQGFPSRWNYVEIKIRQLNGSDKLGKLVRDIFDPRDWINYEKPREDAVAYLNDYLKHDGFEIVSDGDFFALRVLGEDGVVFQAKDGLGANKIFVDQQISKCEKKLSENDFDGAITNARSLLEAVLIGIEHDIGNEEIPPYDGDLIKLYKRIQKLLNLETGRKDIAEPLKQVLGGLASIVTGIASLRNKMGDAHARTYQPAKRHANLVVNSSKTLAAFLVEAKDHYLSKSVR